MFRLALAVVAAAVWTLSALPASADPPPRWNGPFGGEFHAAFTIATDYAQSGISSTENQPAFQAALDWHSPYLLSNGPPLRVYATGTITNVSFPNVGPGEEVDLATGVKLELLDRRLKLDLGYVRYLFPSYPAASGYEYGDWSAKVDYDIGPAIVSGRLRCSPDTVLHAGKSWNKRGLVTVPLDFLPLPEGLRLKVYGSLGNVWVEKPEVVDLLRNDWWYWQIGLVTSVIGLDITLAYTDTDITAERLRLHQGLRGQDLPVGDEGLLRALAPHESHR